MRSRKSTSAGDASPPPAAELTFGEGYWNIRTSPAGPAVRINDVPQEVGRLQPGDVLTIGDSRYRINYQGPQKQQPQAPAAAPARPVAAGTVESQFLGALIPCGGGRSIALRRPRVTVGRAAACDVVVPHNVVSSRHCELKLIRQYWQLTDLGSHNGTFVDGMRYHSKWVLPGNIIGLAKIRYRLEYKAHGPLPDLRNDDVPVLSRRSLTDSVGLTSERLDSLEIPAEQHEPERKRWKIDAD